MIAHFPVFRAHCLQTGKVSLHSAVVFMLVACLGRRILRLSTPESRVQVWHTGCICHLPISDSSNSSTVFLVALAGKSMECCPRNTRRSCDFGAAVGISTNCPRCARHTVLHERGEDFLLLRMLYLSMFLLLLKIAISPHRSGSQAWDQRVS